MPVLSSVPARVGAVGGDDGAAVAVGQVCTAVLFASCVSVFARNALPAPIAVVALS